MNTEIQSPENQGSDQNLDQIIQESKKVLENSEPVTPKRKRGRPRKAGEAVSTDAPQNAPQAPQAAPDITPYLVDPLIAISKFPASKHKMPDLALSRDEAQLCAKSLNDLLQAFVPDLNNMSPKTAAILGVAVTFGSIGFSKYAIYNDEMTKRIGENKEKAKKADELPENTPIIKQEKIDEINIPAENYFRKINV